MSVLPQVIDVVVPAPSGGIETNERESDSGEAERWSKALRHLQ